MQQHFKQGGCASENNKLSLALRNIVKKMNLATVPLIGPITIHYLWRLAVPLPEQHLHEHLLVLLSNFNKVSDHIGSKFGNFLWKKKLHLQQVHLIHLQINNLSQSLFMFKSDHLATVYCCNEAGQRILGMKLLHMTVSHE